MPGWDTVLDEIKAGQQSIDLVRRRYLRELHELTGRSTIAYYSGWLARPADTPNMLVGDDDMNALMATVHQVDKSQGLDLILHTPGGDLAATEALVEYLWAQFDRDIRTFVPQLAMSAGTMIACASREIVMGAQSSLGPIDPQFDGKAAQAILSEFQLALDGAENNPKSVPLWQQIISRYPTTLLVECVQAIDWSDEMARKWLAENMFSAEHDREEKARRIVEFLSDHEETVTHSRHIPASKCREIGLKVVALEDDNRLQDLALTVHHAYMHTFSMTTASKIVENHLGVAVGL